MAGSLTQNFRSPAALSRFLLVALVGLVVDLWTKVWAFRVLVIGYDVSTDGRRDYETLEQQFIPGWLHFKVTANYGAVFGIGQGQRLLFLTVSILAIGFLVYLFAASERRQRVYQVILGMLLAGVIGNLYDRMQFGFVRDMIYALPGWRWPGSEREVFPWIFNIADSLLCVGVALMLVYSIVVPQPAEKKPEGGSREDVAVAKSSS